MNQEWEKEISDFLEKRNLSNTYRTLTLPLTGIDVCSNDYLGLSRSEWIRRRVQQKLSQHYRYASHGATGSRLLSGNSELVEQLEAQIAQFHSTESALLFGSGYMANIGVISTLARAGHIIFYDQNIHASLLQGIALSSAKSFAFAHNNLGDLSNLAQQQRGKIRYVVIESIYSMDGDSIDKEALLALCKAHQLILIVDEAHAVGIYGKKGQGMFTTEEAPVRIVTYGKALGIHGAAVLSNTLIRNYLINFCKTFIYTTAQPLHELLTLSITYEYLYLFDNQKNKLLKIINYFKNKYSINDDKIAGVGPIFAYLIGDTSKAKQLALQLQEKGIYCKPIVYPTVARGQERLRINLHSYNTQEELDTIMQIIYTWKTKATL